MFRLVSCLPILGQLIGGLLIAVGVEDLRAASSRPERIIGVSLILHGILTVLGLGVLCLLIDIIVTVAILIKHRQKNSSSSNLV